MTGGHTGGFLLFAAVAAAAVVSAADAAAPFPAPRDFDPSSRASRLYGGPIGGAPSYPPSGLGAPGVWGEGGSPDEGLQGVQVGGDVEGGAGDGEKEREALGVSSVSSSRRRSASSTKSVRRWADLGPAGGDGERRDVWGRALRTAGSSIRLASRRMYRRTEDYWREPQRRRAMFYFAVVAALAVCLAYGEHRLRVKSTEGQQLQEREAFMVEIDRDLALEKEEVKKGLDEANAVKDEHERTAKELREQEEEVRKLREQLRKRAAALQEEQLMLSVRKAKTRIASQVDVDKRLSMNGGAALFGGGEGSDEETRLYWLDEIARKEAGAALSNMALLETEVRSRYNTLLRLMDLDTLTPQVQQQALRLKEQLRNAVSELEIQVHAALGAFRDDLWVARAERKLLLDPSIKDALRKGIESEWVSQEEHYIRLRAMQQATREALTNNRREIDTLRRVHEEGQLPAEELQQLRGLYFALMSAELYQESFLRVIDADLSRHLNRTDWITKMEALLEEATERARAARDAWATERAAFAELRGKIKAINGILSFLDDKMDLCFTVHKTWSQKWARVESSR